MRGLLAVMVLLAAGPARAETKPTMLPGSMPSLNQGRGSATSFAPAPVPNPDIRVPRTQRDPNAVEISPGLTRTNTGQGMAGDGFSAGSAYTGELERRSGRGGLGSTLAPSVNMKMPVQVEFGSRRP